MSNNREWEIFKGKKSHFNGMKVSLYKSGQLGMGMRVYKAWGEPKQVTLWFDVTSRIIGLKPCEDSDEFAHKMYAGKSKMAVGLQEFCNHYSIDHAVTRQYDAQIEDGMLIIPLEQHPHTDEK